MAGRGASPRLVVFDLDNTLYREPPELSRACEEAMARAASELIEGLSYEEALHISQTSNHQTGSVRAHFMEQYNADPAVLHQMYHNMVDHMVLPVCEDTKAAFAKVSGEKVLLGLLTHGSRGWTDRVLDHLGLSDCFDPVLRVPVEDVDFHHKHESERPFHEIMARASEYSGEVIDAADCMMVEDVERNLSVAHRLGLQTVLVTHGADVPKPDHVDHMVSDVTAVIENFLA